MPACSGGPQATLTAVAVVLLLLVVTISMVIVRVSAFALELTGMPWEQAKFQALSAFSNSGFTTREAEEVVTHPVRRRVISTLIVLGNAGIVTTIGTFAGTVNAQNLDENLINVGVVVGGIVVLFAVTRWKRLMEGIRSVMKRWMSRRYDFQPPQAEHLLRLDQGYGLARIELTDDCPVAGKALQQLDLKSWMVQVLAIEREGNYKPVPRGRDRLMAGDFLVVYGADDAIRKVFRPKKSARLTVMS